MKQTLQEYTDLISRIRSLPEEGQRQINRRLAKTDLFYLLTVILGRKDAFRQWLLDRCNEVQTNPNGHLDLWARGHYKSTTITFALTIQDILKDPEVTIGIFSHSAKIAKDFLKQIRREFDDNALLKSLFPDIFWDNPNKESPSWNNEALIVKRSTNPKEATVEAHGVVDNQPTGKHFKILIYDDVVTRDSVYTPEMIRKTNEAWELSLNLGMEGGIVRYIGTRYHFNDTYKVIMERGAAIPRIHKATIDGTAEGEPVLLTREELRKKRQEMGSYTFSCQMLQNPIADGNAAFNVNNLEFYNIRNEKLMEMARQMNVYIMVDGASSKSANADYTVMMVVGCNHDNNYYLLDMVRDRLSLTERCEALFQLVHKWKPKRVGYEKNSREADIEYIRLQQDEWNYRFPIMEIHTKLNKQDKIINGLQPIFESHRFYLPLEMIKISGDKEVDLVQQFIEEEYVFYPFSTHDDMLDALSMLIRCMGCIFPLQKEDDTDTLFFHRSSSQRGEFDSITGEPLS